MRNTNLNSQTDNLINPSDKINVIVTLQIKNQYLR